MSRGDSSRVRWALHEFPNETREDANRGAEQALERAIAFLQDEACVLHFGFFALSLSARHSRNDFFASSSRARAAESGSSAPLVLADGAGRTW